MTDQDRRTLGPESYEPPAEPAPSRWIWDDSDPTPLSLGTLVVGLVMSALGMAVVGYELVTRLTR